MKVLIFALLYLVCIASQASDKKPAKAFEYFKLGYDLEVQKELADAAHNYFKASKLYADYGNHLSQAKVLERLGIVFYKSYHYNNSLTFHSKTLHLRLAHGAPKHKVAQSMFNIGMAHHKTGNGDSATYYLLEALDTYEDPEMKGDCYHQLAYVQKELNAFDTSVKYYLMAADYTADAQSKASIYNNLGNMYKQSGDTTNALVYLNKSLEYGGVAETYNNIGQIHFAKGDLSKALHYLNEAATLQDTTNVNTNIQDTYRRLANIYEAAGNMPEALRCLKISERLSQRLVNDQADLSELYKYYMGALAVERISQYEKQKQYNFWIVFGLMAFVVFVIGVALMYYFKAKRARQDTTMMQSAVSELNDLLGKK